MRSPQSTADRTNLTAHDLTVLRGLADWKAQAAQTVENKEKIQAWLAHDAGAPDRRVMVMCETAAIRDGAITEEHLECVDPWARRLELSLRQAKYETEALKDDHTLLPWIEYRPCVEVSDFGVPSGVHRDTQADQVSFNYQPALNTLDESDFARLSPRTFRWHRDAEEQTRERLEAVFDGILGVRRRWTPMLPLTRTCLELVGLDGFMLLMYDNPEGLHRLLAFLRDDYLAFVRFLEENALLDLNNEADYCTVGLMGWTRALPAPGYSGTARAKDLWLACDSQESVGISPEHFAEFVLPYMRDIASVFGRTYYGCCEPVDPILDSLAQLPNLQRLSVSYWANEEPVAAFCREKDVVYSRKSAPLFFMGEHFKENVVRDYLKKTVETAEGCRLELIQRDANLCNGDPQRLTRWVELARELSAEHKQ